ncbi:CaiB/BaiF CoA transferase family protein [Motiliproteus sp.]|uniref:CaiB/BaiF CoA transferase family protein n=1 Tax=Motiliproteus sp. TaxID=1898955 RepID=UPI003BA8F865
MPLKSLKVLDFSTLLPGPYATMMLADLGAEVVRIEAPNRVDLLRHLPPLLAEGENQTSACFATLNRNKRAMALDLKNPAAVEAIKQMIGDYDILVEQFRPGVMARLGLGYDELARINPRLIYCSISGYGQSGSHRDRAGHDINYLALSGLAGYSGRAETGPVLSGTQIADIAGGSYPAAVGILAAVIERQHSGRGQSIDISMTDGALAMNALFGANCLVSGKDPQPGSEFLNGGSFYGYYRTADQRYLAVGSLEPPFLKGLLQALGKPEWIGRASDTHPEAVDAFKADIQSIIETRPLQHWCEVFAELDVCVEPVLNFGEAADSELFRSREMLVEVPLAERQSEQEFEPQRVRQIGCPIKFSRSRAEYRSIGSPLGAHTRDVLREQGFSDEQIERMLAAADQTNA